APRRRADLRGGGGAYRPLRHVRRGRSGRGRPPRLAARDLRRPRDRPGRDGHAPVDVLEGRSRVRARRGQGDPEAVADLEIALAATGTHPWTSWKDVRLIDTVHYRRVAEALQYVAWRNQSFVLHLHVGV